jgi:methionine-rich copper-binding protein CopC
MTRKSATGLAGLMVLASTAFAHALLLESTPAANALVSGREVAVQLRFNTRIDATRSRLSVVSPDQTVRPVLQMEPTSADVLRGRIKDLDRGMYRLRWQVLAFDGHIARGEIPFLVK